eukprot:2637302-Rhodomonas_salina.1
MSYDEIKDPVPGGQWSSGICDCFSDCRYLARPGSFAMDLEQLEGASEDDAVQTEVPCTSSQHQGRLLRLPRRRRGRDLLVFLRVVRGSAGPEAHAGSVCPPCVFAVPYPGLTRCIQATMKDLPGPGEPCYLPARADCVVTRADKASDVASVSLRAGDHRHDGQEHLSFAGVAERGRVLVAEHRWHNLSAVR